MQGAEWPVLRLPLRECRKMVALSNRFAPTFLPPPIEQSCVQPSSRGKSSPTLQLLGPAAAPWACLCTDGIDREYYIWKSERQEKELPRLASLHEIIGSEHEIYVFGASRIEFGAFRMSG